jgi:hypothetical protein
VSDIAALLNTIKTAIYGRDVRQAIHDAIRKCYDDGRAGTIDLTARELAKLNASKLQAEISDFTESASGRMDDYETQTRTQIAAELAAINKRLDNFMASAGARTATLIETTRLLDTNTGPEATINISRAQAMEYDALDIYYKTAGTYRKVTRITPDMLTASSGIDIGGILYTNEYSIVYLEFRLTPQNNGETYKLTVYRWQWSGSKSAAAVRRVETNADVGIYAIDGVKYTDAIGDKDGELSDLRVGPDGTTYTSAGEMIRGQLEALKDRLDDIGLYRDADGCLCEEDDV